MGTLRRTCATVPRRCSLPKLLWADLLKMSVVQHYKRGCESKSKFERSIRLPDEAIDTTRL